MTIKKHAAMVQLHYLSGDKLLGKLILELPKYCSVQSVLPVFPTMTGSDNSKHPALKVTSRVRLGKIKFMKETNYSIFRGCNI